MKIQADILIVGGGIAGLYALDRATSAGYSAILLESSALGAGQTLKSQGIIHGGIKFALNGLFNASAKAVELMPARWKACLSGAGDVDLRGVQVLSQHQCIWSTGSMGSELGGFFASKAMKSRVHRLSSQQYPKIFQNTQFKGQVWQLDEIVLDIQTLLQVLSERHQNRIFKVEPNTLEFRSASHNIKSQNNLEAVIIHHITGKIEINPKHSLMVAGQGNELIAKALGLSQVPMQTRPLHMVLAKGSGLSPLFAHCIETGTTPRITITSHIAQDGEMVWYLGGTMAETGVVRTTHSQIAYAQEELNSLFPWLDFSDIKFVTFSVDRAEAKQPNGKRPDGHYVKTLGNISMGWPTKLALTPVLVDSFLKKLPPANKTQCNVTFDENCKGLWKRLGSPPIATPIWDELFSHPHVTTSLSANFQALTS